MVVKKSMILDQICGQVGRYYMAYKTGVQKLVTVRLHGGDPSLLHKLTLDLQNVEQEIRDGFGHHAERIVEILDQILHINREVQSKKPTNLQILRDLIGQEGSVGKSNIQLVKLFRKLRLKLPEMIYPQFNHKSKESSQEFIEQRTCVGPYYINFGLYPNRLQEETKNMEVVYLQTLVLDLINSQYRWREANKVE